MRTLRGTELIPLTFLCIFLMWYLLMLGATDVCLEFVVQTELMQKCFMSKHAQLTSPSLCLILQIFPRNRHLILKLISLPQNSFNSIETGPTFQCTVSTSQAYGSSLEVLWTQGEKKDVSQQDPNQYSTRELSRVTNGGVTSVSSEMMIMSVRLNDSGQVSCKARISPSNISGGFPVTATANTTLTVLGGFQNILASITQEGLVLYDIRLYNVVPIPK